jgi:ribosomal protein S15P/S13E
MTKDETSGKEKLTQKEYEKRVLALAKEGLTTEKIGEKLKKEGIHSKEYSNKISKILGKDYINPDLKNIEKKLEKIKTHYETNKQDKRAKREKDRIFAQLRKVKKYLGLIPKKK